MDLAQQLKEFSNSASQTVDAINKSLPGLMEHLTPQEKAELETTLKKQNWDSIKDNLGKANEMINNIPK